MTEKINWKEEQKSVDFVKSTLVDEKKSHLSEWYLVLTNQKNKEPCLNLCLVQRFGELNRIIEVDCGVCLIMICVAFKKIRLKTL